MRESNDIKYFGELDYDPFGMLNAGRSFDVGSGYRYGFNGKENEDDIAGNNNDLDFSARVYDSRLAKWMSVDNLTAKYSAWSPYAFGFNSPITTVDMDGKENVIYLVVLPSAYNSITAEQAADIINQANLNFESLGVQTRVVLATEACKCETSAFDPKKIDATDGIAVLGSGKDVSIFINSFSPNVLGLGDDFTDPEDHTNPEVSENNNEDNGKWIALDASDLKTFGLKLDEEEGSLSQRMVKFGAILINHGAGHLAGADHTGSILTPADQLTTPKINGFTFSLVMQDGNDLWPNINNIGYDQVTRDTPSETYIIRYSNDGKSLNTTNKVTSNPDYDRYIKKRFGDKPAKANYLGK